MKRSGSPLGGATAALILVGLLCALCVFGAALSIYQTQRSHDFVKVQGRIVDEEYGRARDKTGESQRERRQRRNTVYFNVRYIYTVDGVEYEGNRIQPGTFGMISAANKRNFAERFTTGKDVPVYVDPADPRTAVLVRGWSSVTTMLSVLSAFFAVALWILWVVRKALATPRLPR